MWSLCPEHFKMIYTCFPSLPEQAAIVHFLEYRTHLIADVVTGKLDIREHIEAALKECSDLRVVRFEPGDTAADTRGNYSTDVPTMTAGRAALVGLIDCYLRGLLDPFVTLLEVHKLMYFMQDAGEPLKLQFQKGTYGPYAENLRHVLQKVEGHLVSGYADGGDRPDKELQLVPGALAETNAVLQTQPATRTHLKRVSDLVEGFESPFGLELLSTVHWVATKEPVQSIDDVVMRTYNWNTRKKQFSKRQIALAVNVLSQKHWLGNVSISNTA